MTINEYQKEALRTASDVANMMILLKIARGANGKPKADTWIDIAGYAACGGELQGDRGVPAP